MPRFPAAFKHILHKKGKTSSKSNKGKDSTTGQGGTTVTDLSMSYLQEQDERPSSPNAEISMMQRLNLGNSRSQSDVIRQYGSPSESQVSRLTSGGQSDVVTRPPRHNRAPASLTRTQGSSQLPEQHGVPRQPDESVSLSRSGGYGSRSGSEGSGEGARGKNTVAGAEKHESMTSDYQTMSQTSIASSGTAARPPHPLSPSPLLVNADRTDSLDSVSSSEPSTLAEYPTVIERRQGAAAASAGSSVISAGRGGRPHRGHTAPLPSSDRGRQSSRGSVGSSHSRPSSRTAPVSGGRGVVPGGTPSGGPAARGSSGGIVVPFPPVKQEEVEGELFPQSALGTPIGALRKSRKRLCLMLNIEQEMVETDYTPDYRGLAEMLGFDTIEIQNLWERNPSDTLFIEWGRCRDSTLLSPILGTLVDCLEKLGRRDVLEDCRGLILEDVSDYIAEEHLKERYRVGRFQQFDCYVNIADQDILTIGREILDTLEGVYNLRLCLTLRDITLGGCEFDKMAEMLETRCDSKVLIVLSRNYESSDACQFLTQFAVTLDPGSRKNKLIPLLVDEDTVIPRVLRCLAMLNFYRDRRLGFLWPRLHHAITQ